MDKDVIISVKGTAEMNEYEPMELITEGKYSKVGEDNYLVSYNESEMTGMGETTTTLEIAKDTVIMKRVGSVNTSFVFKKGETNISHYSTEYGVFTIGIKAKNVSINVDDNGGELEINYELDTFDAKKSRNNFYLKIREVKG